MTVNGACDLPVVSQVCSVASGASKAIGFASDPLGYIAQQMGSAASGMVTVVLPGMEKLTHPDLTQRWFINAYEFTFALAMFMFVVFLGNNFVQRARRKISGDDLIETLTFYIPAFFVGVIFGPLIGTGILSFTGALTDVVVSSQLTPSTDQTIATLNANISAGDPASITGGSIIAIVFFGLLILAMLIVFVALLVMLVTLYLTGAIFPLSLVWLVNPAQRHKGLKVVSVWLGICFSHVLIFLMLGLAFRIVASTGTELQGDPSLLELANLAVAIIVLFIAGLSPLALLKFAPIGPSMGGAGGGPSLSIPSPRRSQSSLSGETSASDSQTAQLARSTPSPSADGGSFGGGAPQMAEAGLATATAGPAGGGLLGLLDRARGTGSEVSADSDATGGSGAGGATPSLEQTTAPSAGPASAESGPGGVGQLAAGGNSSAAAAGGAAAGGATGGTVGGVSTAAAGAAATGVGLPLAAGIAAAQHAAGAAQSLGDMAAEHMEHGEPESGTN